MRDWDIVDNELIFRDLGVIDNRLSKLRAKKKLTPDEDKEKALLEKCYDCLMEEKPLSSIELKPEETRQLRGFALRHLEAADNPAQPRRKPERRD